MHSQTRTRSVCLLMLQGPWAVTEIVTKNRSDTAGDDTCQFRPSRLCDNETLRYRLFFLEVGNPEFLKLFKPIIVSSRGSPPSVARCGPIVTVQRRGLASNSSTARRNYRSTLHVSYPRRLNLNILNNGQHFIVALPGWPSGKFSVEAVVGPFSATRHPAALC